MTESGERQSKFVYLLNAMENAAQSEHPYKAGYPDKRAAVLKYVADLEVQAAFEAGRGGWISVEERLPEIETPVDAIVCGTERIIAMRVCNTDEGWCWAQCRDSGFDLKDGYTLAEFEEDDLNVTHWMALPAPPDSGDKKG